VDFTYVYCSFIIISLDVVYTCVKLEIVMIEKLIGIKQGKKFYCL